MAHYLYIYCMAVTIRFAVNLGLVICAICCIPCLLVAMLFDSFLILLEIVFGIVLISFTKSVSIAESCEFGILLWHAAVALSAPAYHSGLFVHQSAAVGRIFCVCNIVSAAIRLPMSAHSAHKKHQVRVPSPRRMVSRAAM